MGLINDYIKKTYKWTLKEAIYAIFGCFIFSFAVNIFIVPQELYNGGILGLSQLIRSVLPFHFSFDIAGILTLLINIPLFIMSYKFISKTFFRRTLICMLFQTIFLTVIPVFEKAIIDDVLTSVLIGGILAGYGCGITLSASGSSGGTDIIGLIASMRNKYFTVGKISRIINFAIYAVCGILYGLPTMIYSIIYAVISSLVIDQTHQQNICSYVMIFTKDKPSTIVKFIRDELDRDATYWEAYGAYKTTKTYVCYSAMSKYEMQRLERHLIELNPEAFMITSEGIGIEGNFEKKLSH